MIPVIFDHQLYYCESDDGCSLLSLPLRHGTYLDFLLEHLGDAAREKLAVIPSFAPNQAYLRRLEEVAPRGVCVLDMESQRNWSTSLEPQEVVCMFDPLRYPLQPLNLADVWRQNSLSRGAVHLVAVGPKRDTVTEDLDHDSEGHVRSVRRSFGCITPPAVANTSISASLVRGAVIRNLVFSSLLDLRIQLAKGGVLTADVPVNADVAEMRHETGYLKLNAWTMSTCAGKRSLNGRKSNHNGRVADATSVPVTTRLLGPVIIQPGCSIGRNVTIVGPTVIGRRARIADGATVVQSVVAANSSLQEGVDSLHRVVSGVLAAPQRSPRTTDIGVAGIATSWPYSKTLSVQSPLGDQDRRRPSMKIQLAVKRVSDLLLAGIGHVVLGLPMLIVALLIRLDSRGPIFFSHQREGKGGREFPCLKFRTMVPDAHSMQRELYAQNQLDGPQFKMSSDPRVTRLGAFLRRTNLDELPQLINVLVGQMSLIGPRPSPFRENQICVPWRRARLSVRPGISGLWQICRDERDGGDFHQWIYYDLLYVRHWSLLLDAKILAATILTLGGKWQVPLSWIIPSRRLHASHDDQARDTLMPGRSEGDNISSSAA